MASKKHKYKINTDAYQFKARKQLGQQAGLLGQEARLLTIALVRKPALIAEIEALYACGGKLPDRAANEQQYVTGCAIRVFTHFNPQHGYCAKAPCLRCNCEIDDSSNISIVMLTLPPWDKKSSVLKTAAMAGFFCAACDVHDDEANAIWTAEVKAQGIQLVLTNTGLA